MLLIAPAIAKFIIDSAPTIHARRAPLLFVSPGSRAVRWYVHKPSPAYSVIELRGITIERAIFDVAA